MAGTVLLYSSHDRCNVIHDALLVQRALAGRENKRIVFLPFSCARAEDQRSAWDGFRWFFDFYSGYGLEYFPFYWTETLRPRDVEELWRQLTTAEVVVLGGGSSRTGLSRYKDLGARFDNEPGKFGRLLHERQRNGLLTAGFSAGADQLSEYLFARTWNAHSDTQGFGLARNVMVYMHHEREKNHLLWEAAQKFGHVMAFGLPNDSALSLDQGILPSGNWWQVIEFVIDTSWSKPEDTWHVKTRAGELIEHVYPTGQHYAFHGGQRLVRIQSVDNRVHEAWIEQDGGLIDYWTQQRADEFKSIEDVLASH